MLKINRAYFIVVCMFISIIGYSQAPLYMAPKVAKTYKKDVRNVSGTQGANFWMNKPSYKLDIKFDPTTTLLEGSGTIDYTNNSPDVLERLTISLLGNIYKKKIKRDWNISADAEHDGTVVTRFKVNGEEFEMGSKNLKVSGTNMYVTLENPIQPNTTAKIEMDWHVLFPEKAVIRSGNYGDSTFFISYFYPKMSVYDDVDGWDNAHYQGYSEFYGEFSDFEVNLTLPGDFFVWSTGELQNGKEIYTKKIYKKWQKAIKSDKVTSIIGEKQVGKSKTYGEKTPKTWKIRAKNVTDFAFGTSNNFMWDCRSVVVDNKTGRRAIVNAAYNPESEDYREVASITADALDDFSNTIPGVPYPYPVMTVFNGNAGMEFPMMCNDASQTQMSGTAGLAYHEIAHSYFPFYLGTNERKYAWMDEGWASFFPAFYMEEYGTSFKSYFMSRKAGYENFAGSENESPLMFKTNEIRGRQSYRHAAYSKPFMAYYYLMDYLGKEKFATALQGYMNTWAGKHPIPHDFFNAINSHSDENLNWYWESWFFDRSHADLGIGDVTNTTVEILNVGRLFVPIHLEVTYEDGSVDIIDEKLSIWKNNGYKTVITTDIQKEIKLVKLGDWNIIDVDNSNNTYEK